MSRGEKRKHIRLSIELEVVCSKVDNDADEFHIGKTVDVSTGGLSFDIFADHFQPGHLLNIELSIPPTKGLMELGGRLSASAKVLRTTPTDPASHKKRVAIQFCQPPHFWI